MSKRALGVVMAGLLMATSGHSAIVVGGQSYASNAGVDQLLGSTGTFTTSGGTVVSALTDTDASTYAFSFSTGAAVNLGWLGRMAQNGSGTDIDLYELGTPDSLQVTINSITKTYLAQSTGLAAGGYALNRVSVELSDFGIASGAGVGSLWVGMGLNVGTVPSLSFVGANVISAVPEVSSVLMMGLGLMGLMGVARRQSR